MAINKKNTASIIVYHIFSIPIVYLVRLTAVVQFTIIFLRWCKYSVQFFRSALNFFLPFWHLFWVKQYVIVCKWNNISKMIYKSMCHWNIYMHRMSHTKMIKLCEVSSIDIWYSNTKPYAPNIYMVTAKLYGVCR